MDFQFSRNRPDDLPRAMRTEMRQSLVYLISLPTFTLSILNYSSSFYFTAHNHPARNPQKGVLQ